MTIHSVIGNMTRSARLVAAYAATVVTVTLVAASVILLLGWAEQLIEDWSMERRIKHNAVRCDILVPIDHASSLKQQDLWKQCMQYDWSK